MKHVSVHVTIDGLWKFLLADIETDEAILFDKLILRSELVGEPAKLLAEALADERLHYVNFEVTIQRGEEQHGTQ